MNIRKQGLLATLGLVSAFCAACDSEPEAEPPPPEVAVVDVEEQLSDVVCGLAAECECNFGRQFSTNAECLTWAGMQQSEAERLMNTYDLTWEPTCVGWYVRAFEELECASQDLFPNDPDGDGCGACQPLHGDKLAGASCTEYEYGFSDCGQGMRCQQGTCIELCPEPQRLGEPCDFEGCGEGLYCDVFTDATPVCREKAGDGEDCSVVECAEQLRCVLGDPMDPMSARCESLATTGQACMGHADCTTRYCPAGFCEEIPGEGGDCRGTGVCGDGLFCIDDVCAKAKERGESCNMTCGGGLDCIEGVCVGANAAACRPPSPVGN